MNDKNCQGIKRGDIVRVYHQGVGVCLRATKDIIMFVKPDGAVEKDWVELADKVVSFIEKGKWIETLKDPEYGHLSLNEESYRQRLIEIDRGRNLTPNFCYGNKHPSHGYTCGSLPEDITIKGLQKVASKNGVKMKMPIMNKRV